MIRLNHVSKFAAMEAKKPSMIFPGISKMERSPASSVLTGPEKRQR